MAVLLPFSAISDVYSPLAILASCLLVYNVLLVFYRLYLSPIASFPGPKLAAASGWYETYLDVFKGGEFTFHIQKWHQKYGPIIRINPWEVHISDPDFYEVMYSSKTRFDKKKAWENRFGVPGAVVATSAHDLHHRRRVALNPYFSKRRILEFSNQMQTCVEEICNRLVQEYSGTSKVLKLNDVWATFSTDNIIFYTFGKSYEYHNYPDFVAPFTRAGINITRSTHFAAHFPWAFKILRSMPNVVVGWLIPTIGPALEFNDDVKAQIVEIVTGENQAHQKVDHQTVVSNLLESNLPPEELYVTRLRDETVGILGAAIETAKATLCVASFHLLNNRILHQQLWQELKIAIPDPTKPPPLTELEKLPYLTAVIYESLRLSYGAAQRLPRVSPSAPVQYKNHTIPPNVPFSMSIYILHHDELIFPNSHTFDPARWLHDPKFGDKPLTRYLTSFSRGTRVCLGLHFAWAELYIGLANVFRRLDFELVETGEDSVTMAKEFFLAAPKEGTQGVRVRVK